MMNNSKNIRPIPFNKQLKLAGVFIFFAVHVALGYLTLNSGLISKVHGIVVLSIGCIYALFGGKRENVLYIAGYIVGAEVLWRMTHGSIVYEIGKYAVILIFSLSMIVRGWGKKWAPWIYFFLLAISILVMPASGVNIMDARDQLSFNLSGPLCLMVCVLFISRIKITSYELHRLFIAMLGPIISIATITRYKNFTAEEVYVGTGSSFIASGFAGPNQVSAILGLGAFLVFYYLMDGKKKLLMKGILSFLGFVLATQCALTFSRSGLYCAAGAAIAASFFLVQNRKAWGRYVIVFSLLFIGVNYIAIPRLIQFTGGAIEQRFKETSMSGRESIMADDLRIWKENFIFGVGPGMASTRRSLLDGKKVAAHTEYTRMLAEHGIFGFFAIIVLLCSGISFLKRAKTSNHKALVISALVWSSLFMAVSAMRIAAPSFIYGLAAVQFLEVISVSRKKQSQGVNTERESPRFPEDRSEKE